MAFDRVARMERSGMRERATPDFAPLHPGYSRPIPFLGMIFSENPYPPLSRGRPFEIRLYSRIWPAMMRSASGGSTRTKALAAGSAK
jgi:hypothetical protein